MPKIEAILIAAGLYILLSAVWYSSALFGDLWKKANGLRDRQLQLNNGRAYRASFVAALIMAYVLAQIIRLSGSESIAQGLSAGFWLWLGLVLTTLMTHYTFSQRPMMVLLIDSAFSLFALLMMGVVLVAI